MKQGENDIEWSSYSPEEAREGLKRLSSKKGPPFDILATPEKDNVEETRSGSSKNTTTRRLPPAWEPPARKGTNGQPWRSSSKDPGLDDTTETME